MFKDRLSHIGPEEFLYHYLNSDSSKQNQTPNLPSSPQKRKSLERFNSAKNIQVYLEELKSLQIRYSD